jgi:hypothetical protein
MGWDLSAKFDATLRYIAGTGLYGVAQNLSGTLLAAGSVALAKLAAPPVLLVAFTATNAAYALPSGYKLQGAWLRPGAYGGVGGGGGSNSNSGSLGGGAGAGGRAGGSCTLTFAPVVAPAGSTLVVTIGAGSAGGAGGAGSVINGAGGQGLSSVIPGDTSIAVFGGASLITASALITTLGNTNGSVSGATGGAAATAMPRWPSNVLGQNPGSGGSSAAAGGAPAAMPTVLPFGSSSYVNVPTAAPAGTASVGARLGGGGGGGGASSSPGDECGSGLGAVPAATSGAGGAGGAGGDASDAGTSPAPNPGSNGTNGTMGRGGGGGGGGGGRGRGTTSPAAGGAGGNGGSGSDGAVILVLVAA